MKRSVLLWLGLLMGLETVTVLLIFAGGQNSVSFLLMLAGLAGCLLAFAGLSRTAVRRIEEDARQEALQKLRHMELAQLAAMLQQGEIAAGADSMPSFETEGAGQPARLSYCANRLADAVLFDAKRQMKEQGIKCEIHASVPEEIGLDPGVLMSLLSNLLDNAIQAAARCPDKDRFVSFEIFLRKGQLICLCDNSVTEDMTMMKGISTKAQVGHGQGLEILEDLCTRHQGTFQWEITGGLCKCVAMMRTEEHQV